MSASWIAETKRQSKSAHRDLSDKQMLDLLASCEHVCPSIEQRVWGREPHYNINGYATSEYTSLLAIFVNRPFANQMQHSKNCEAMLGALNQNYYFDPIYFCVARNLFGTAKFILRTSEVLKKALRAEYS